MRYRYTIDRCRARTRLTLADEINFGVFDELRATIGEALTGGPTALTIDVGGLEFIDCSCIGLFMATRHRLVDDGGTLTLANARGTVRHVLDVLDLLPCLTGHRDSRLRFVW